MESRFKILCLMLVVSVVFLTNSSFSRAEDPEPIVELFTTQTIPPDYQPPIDPAAEYKVTISAKFNHVDGVLAMWLQARAQELALDGNCELTFNVHRLSEEQVQNEELVTLSEQLHLERRKVNIEREKLMLMNEMAALKKSHNEILAGEEPSDPIAYRQSSYEDSELEHMRMRQEQLRLFRDCLDQNSYEHCEHLEP